MPNIDSPLQEPHPRHASATIVTTEREYIPPKPPTRNILPRGSPHKRTPIGQRASVSAVWDRPGLVIVVHHNACVECPCSIRHRRRYFQVKTIRLGESYLHVGTCWRWESALQLCWILSAHELTRRFGALEQGARGLPKGRAA